MAAGSAEKRWLLSSALLQLLLLLAEIADGAATSSPSVPFSRTDFPVGFIFGVGSSAYQYEGAAFEDGKGPNIWDTFTQRHSSAIADGSSGDVADDQYHRCREDVELLSDMGVDSYRLSISWSRILPDGRGEINQFGVNYYNNLINLLLEKGILPFLSLYHWDLPQALDDAYGGWLNQSIINNFSKFANICFHEFGDRVKHWTTFNEPNIFIVNGYNSGIFAPYRCSKYIGDCTNGNSATEPYIVGHNVLLSHAKVVDIYKKHYQKQQGGSIGISINGYWCFPLYDTFEDRQAAQRSLEFTFGWFLDPIMFGDYPSSMRARVGDRLPYFSKREKRMLTSSIDYIGINYYTSYYVSNGQTSSRLNEDDYYSDQNVTLTGVRDGQPIGEQEGFNLYYIVPEGIYEIVSYATKRYNRMPIYITENGFSEINNTTMPLDEALNDVARIKFHKDHLYYLRKSIEKGANVRGYFPWTFLDDFEWSNGYTIRFGLYYVDFKTLYRYAKASAKWYKAFLSSKRWTFRAQLID